ncbi:hypothetical protein QBC44DRAFT_62429 [Cladorrhinum sp. PSN332]|nr:hypothetical protein QBC44DRAFT_62429 [Cladorrhinum sp. PSN332]
MKDQYIKDKERQLICLAWFKSRSGSSNGFSGRWVFYGTILPFDFPGEGVLHLESLITNNGAAFSFFCFFWMAFSFLVAEFILSKRPRRFTCTDTLFKLARRPCHFFSGSFFGPHYLPHIWYERVRFLFKVDTPLAVGLGWFLVWEIFFRELGIVGGKG